MRATDTVLTVAVAVAALDIAALERAGERLAHFSIPQRRCALRRALAPRPTGEVARGAVRARGRKPPGSAGAAAMRGGRDAVTFGADTGIAVLRRGAGVDHAGAVDARKRAAAFRIAAAGQILSLDRAGVSLGLFCGLRQGAVRDDSPRQRRCRGPAPAPGEEQECGPCYQDRESGKARSEGRHGERVERNCRRVHDRG